MDSIIKDALNKFLFTTISEFLFVIKANKLLTRICCFGIVSMMAIGLSIAVSGITVAYKVNYEGNYIAKIKTTKSFDSAKEKVITAVEGNAVEDVICDPEYSMTIALSGNLDNEDIVAKAIIENTPEIVTTSNLLVNGESKAAMAADELLILIDKVKNRFNPEGVQCTSSFLEEVTIENTYCLTSELADAAQVEEILNTLSVETVYNTVSEIVSEYSTITEKVSTQPVEYSAVKKEGQNGITHLVQKVTAVNGQETGRSDIESVVVAEKIDKVIEVGTARITKSRSASVNTAGFIFPLEKNSWRLSAYYGDGRNHKGVDLCAKAGTNIYAAADGKVISAGYDGGYGYSVLIDHGNGLKTRYAHASRLLVTAGQTVAQGDVLALVGSTGNSTGNHLHFEVIANGSNVDPALYIGLN